MMSSEETTPPASTAPEEHTVAETTLNSDDEDALFEELERDDDLLAANLRERRIEELRREMLKAKEERETTHGTYDTLRNEKDVLQATTSIPKCVVHFAHKDFRRCVIMDRHLAELARKHPRTRFCKVSVEDAPFLVDRLKVKVLPCVISFIDGITVDRLIGFEEVGDKDDFPTSALEKRLAVSKVISVGPTHEDQRRPIFGFTTNTGDSESDNDD
ncbi:hypothetical protein HK104_000008 [Borealophlyctis nickersoniae]|nr:hypothetical protein HK104_000008 [Borealophlyctis nickersoniae]